MPKDYSKPFYNSKEWAGIRNSILMRDKYICKICGEPATEVHHIKRINPGNIDLAETHKDSNLVSLCRDCHFREHDKDRTWKRIDCNEEYYFDADGFLQLRIPPR